MDTALLTSIAAIITALATLLLVLEMRGQRRSLHLPQLALDTSSFKVDSRSPENPERGTQRLLGKISSESINCFNIGAGGAREVSARWIWDHYEQIASIGHLIKPGEFDMFAEDGTLSIRYSRGGHLYPLEFCNECSFLAPLASSESHSDLRLSVPSTYLELLSLFLHTTDVDNLTPILPATTLRLELSYKDIQGNPYAQLFEIKPTFTRLTRNETTGPFPTLEISGGWTAKRIK